MLFRIKNKLCSQKLKKIDTYRNPSDYVDHMALYEKIMSRNSLDINVLEEIQKAKKVGLFIPSTQNKSLWHNIWPLLEGKEVLYIDSANWDHADIYIISGIGRGVKSYLERVNYMQTPCYSIDETFFKSVMPFSMSVGNDEVNESLFKGVSLFLDTRGIHFFPGITTQLEHSINSDELVSGDNLEKSRKLIDKIVENKLSKYNCQPVLKPSLPNNDKKNVLVIDQAYRDFSVAISGAEDESFENMLNQAIKENPECNIIIKTHVDKVSNATYFSRLELPENVIVYSDQINPMSLMEEIDKVYCYSSTVGWEALLVGKKVHVFGSPIYAGWGLTEDRRGFSHRRLKKRSLEELFYFIYLKHSVYVNPETNRVCDIEEAIDYIIEKRNDFLQQFKG